MLDWIIGGCIVFLVVAVVIVIILVYVIGENDHASNKTKNYKDKFIGW